MTTIVQLAQALAALAMGVIVTGFSAMLMVASFRSRPEETPFESNWWAEESMFFLVLIFFVFAGFGLIWYGTAFFVPAISPGSLLGLDFLPGLNMMIGGLFGFVMVASAISGLFWSFVPLSARFGTLILFGGVGGYLMWLPYVGIRDQVSGTSDLSSLIAGGKELSLLIEPFISFFVALLFLAVLRTDIKNLFLKKLSPTNSVVIAIFSLLVVTLLVTAVLAYCVRILHIEELKGASDTLSGGMDHLNQFKGTAIGIYEWGFILLLGLGFLIKRLFHLGAGIDSIVTPGKILLAIVSMVLAGLYIAKMI